VQSLLVVELDPLGRGDLEVSGVTPRTLGDGALGFVQPIDRLGQSVIVTIALGADRGRYTGLFEAFGVDDGKILHPTV